MTDDQIATQEERLGIRLPAPWRNVYKHFNGGWVHTLYWGDMNNPRMNGIEPIPQSSHEYLALEDVAPLRDLLPTEREGLDCSSLDPRLIVKVHRTVTPRAGTLKCLNQLLFPGFSKGHDRLRLYPPSQHSFSQ